MTQHPAAPPAQRAPGATLDALADALRSERRLLDELVAIMRRQRASVAADDLQSVDDSVFATHRVLLTLGEARRRRRSLNLLLGGSEEMEVRELESLLGPAVSAPLREALDALRAAALVLSREVEVNRRVLRQALAAGDDYVRALCGAPVSSAEPRGGTLLDTRA
jgi:hypothetical protein